MNFKHSKNLQESIDGMKKIFSISWSPNLMRLAVAHVDEKRNVRITLYDENGEKQESFPTRPANKNNKSYVVREIAFSPDSTKLAVSQSDNIVFIYNLGPKWGDKKTICNKFEQTTQVTAMIWPNSKPNELYFGVAEGKLKAGILKTNFAQILYSTETYVVSLCASTCGKLLLSGHIDQSIYKHSLESGTTNKIINYSSIPYCLSWSYSILVAGNESKVTLFNDNGEQTQVFDYSLEANDNIKDFTVSRANSSGELIAVGNFDKFFVYMFNFKKNFWEEALIKNIPNYFTITAMCWRPDMSSLVTGSLCGSLDIFESCLKKSLYGDKFELIYLSHSQVMIKNLENSKRIVLKSSSNSEITKINIHHNQFIVSVTKDSLIIGDIYIGAVSEVPWNYTGMEKFDFGNKGICMMHHSGEVIIIEFGVNDIIGYCRTEHIHPNLISARINYLKSPFARRYNSTSYAFSGAYNLNNQNSNSNLNNLVNNNINNNVFNSPNNTQTYFNNSNMNILSKYNFNTTKNTTNFFGFSSGNINVNSNNTNGFASGIANIASVKIIAYLIDALTIQIQDLAMQSIISQVNHDCNIEFLDLNKNGSRLIFRDSKRCLYIFYIEENRREILLNFCNFVQWIPNSDVLVAQDVKNLYVWYHIDDHENSRVMPVKGEVEEVRRVNSKTEVLVDEFGETQVYLLDENLINLSQTIENYDIYNAVNIIESIDFENKAMEAVYWKALGKKALEEFTTSKEKKYIFIAQRCFAAVGQYAKVKYLKDISKKVSQAEEDVNNPNSNNEIILIQAKLLTLDKQFLNAENLLLANNMERDAISLLNSYQKYEDSLRIAERYNFPDTVDIKDKLLQYLLDNKIYNKAGLLYEKDGNFESAIKLYIEGNFFVNAVNLIIREKNNINNKKFSKQNIDKKIVEFLCDSLLNSGLFEKCGEFVSEISDDIDKAVEIFLRGNCFEKALSIAQRNILLAPNSKKTLLKKIEENWGDYLFNQGFYEQATSHYLEAESTEKSISCYINTKKWSKAIELLENIKNENLSKQFYIKIADNYRKEKNLELAEKYYNKAGEIEKILELYIDLQAWDKLEYLITKYDLKKELIGYGARLEEKGKLKEAEKAYVYAQEFDLAIKMYKDAKFYEEMIELVKKHLPEILDKTYDMLGDLCEKDFNFKKAEEFYLKTNSPNKAVEMYFANNLIEEALKLLYKIYLNNSDTIYKIIIEYKTNYGISLDSITKILIKLNFFDLVIKLECYQGNYEKAINIAEQHAKEHLNIVYFFIAEAMKNSKNFSKAEEFYLKSKRYSSAIKMYEEINDFNSAFRISRTYNEEYLPTLFEKEGYYRLTLKEYENAEICFNKAGKADIMYQAYLNLNMQQKANEFAKKYCPKLLANQSLLNNEKEILNNLYINETNNSLSSLNNSLALAEKKEKEGFIKEAIEIYIDIAENNQFKQREGVLLALNKAQSLIRANYNNKNKNFQMEKNNLVESIVQKYIQFEEYKSAGDLLKFTNQFSRALNTYLAGDLDMECQELIEDTSGPLKQQLITIYSKIKTENSLAQQNSPTSLLNNTKDGRANKNSSTKSLIASQDLIEEANFIQDINKLYNEKKYEEILILFKNRNKNTEIFSNIFIQIANNFFNTKNYLDLCLLLNKTEINLTNKTLFVLKNLAMEILAEENLDEIESLKILMDKRFKNFSDPTVVNSPEEISELIRLHKITHFQNIKLSLSNHIGKAKDLYYSLNLSLLQYGDILSIDKILLEVIKISKLNNNLIGNAFIFSDKFLELIESMENATIVEVDEQSLLTNIPWKRCFLSEKNILTKEEMIDMKNWVVKSSINKDIEKKLLTWNCTKCSAENFEGNSSCVKCNYKFDQCIISGSAIRDNSGQTYKTCIGCHKKAIDKYWKDWITLFKYCPWCKKSYK